ncbi:MAG: nitroreductase/quinone reductase family protein [Actinomycetota bacterium]
MNKFDLSRAAAKYLVNPFTKLAAGRLPGAALVKTTGRRTGRPRYTPVGYRIDGGTVWLVAEHGRRADWVRNLEAHPEVGVKIRGRWLSGTGRVMPDEDPAEHLRRQRNKLSAATVRLVGTDPTVVRVDLEG